MTQFRLRPFAISAVAAALLVTAACTMKSQEAPALTGPSEYGTSISVSVSPDVLTQDGASQSLVTVTVRDAQGTPARNVSLRTAIAVGGVFADYGTLSARSLVTDSAGRATLVYTAPLAGGSYAVDNGTVVDIVVTPVGTDFNNSSARIASIRLIPVGVVVPPDGLKPLFTISPAAATDHQNVFFDATTSSAPSNNPIASYRWDFGDGSTGSGSTTLHAFDEPGTYAVTLTIVDELGRSASTTKSITVSQGSVPTASFAFSPTDPQPGDTVTFNGALSTASPGRRIVSYTWDFGDAAAPTPASGMQVTHRFNSVRTYTVTLTVTDDAGRTNSKSSTVQVK